MMYSLQNNATLMMERSLDFLWSKQTAILENLANVETPGYKTKYVTFEETLRQKLAGASAGGAQTRKVLENARPMLHVAQSESNRDDDNSVNATEQGLELSRNGLQMQYVINSITSDYALLRSAIRGQ